MGTSITNWQAVVSTPTVSAKDHLGGYSSSVSVFQPSANNAKIATSLTTSAGGLWAGTLVFNDLTKYLDGTDAYNGRIWTGSADNGDRKAGQEMSTANVAYGYTYQSSNWFSFGSRDAGTPRPLFAVSPELIAVVAPVPEIDPATGSGALSLVAGVLAMIEQRRRRATLVA